MGGRLPPPASRSSFFSCRLDRAEATTTSLALPLRLPDHVQPAGGVTGPPLRVAPQWREERHCACLRRPGRSAGRLVGRGAVMQGWARRAIDDRREGGRPPSCMSAAAPARDGSGGGPSAAPPTRLTAAAPGGSGHLGWPHAPAGGGGATHPGPSRSLQSGQLACRPPCSGARCLGADWQAGWLGGRLGGFADTT